MRTIIGGMLDSGIVRGYGSLLWGVGEVYKNGTQHSEAVACFCRKCAKNSYCLSL